MRCPQSSHDSGLKRIEVLIKVKAVILFLHYHFFFREYLKASNGLPIWQVGGGLSWLFLPVIHLLVIPLPQANSGMHGGHNRPDSWSKGHFESPTVSAFCDTEFLFKVRKAVCWNRWNYYLVFILGNRKQELVAIETRFLLSLFPPPLPLFVVTKTKDYDIYFQWLHNKLF